MGRSRPVPAPPESTAVDVGPATDFEHGVPRIVTIGSRQVGVVRWGDRYFAVRNHCPDQGGPLAAGAVRSRLLGGLASEHVDLSLDENRPVIACPWHHYEFDLETGHELRGGLRAVIYHVWVEAGRVYVRSGRSAT